MDGAKTVPAVGADALVGADRGVTVTAALSNGQLLTMPAFLSEARDLIAELQRQPAVNRKGSVAWKQLNRRIARTYRQAKNRSDNWARGSAQELVAAYGVICLEDLKLTNMMASASGTVWAVPAKNRSRRCAACGHVAATNREGPRFVCGKCGHTNHADINAAENIATLGYACETAWDQAGRPPMVRPKPRLRRRKVDNQTAPATALAA